jgi:chitinase
MRIFLKMVVSMAVYVWSLNAAQAQGNPRIIAYYTGSAQQLDQYPIAGLSHVIFSFLHLKGNVLAYDSPAQEANVKAMVALKSKYLGLKINISLGGWTGCATCSPVFSTAENREAFAQATLAILQKHQLDGIDLDWEYPAIEGPPGHPFSPADKDNFTDLVRRLRKALGNTYELTFAAGGFPKFLEQSIDWAAVTPMVDYINLMSYDLVSGFATQTGHHTALHSTASQYASTDQAVQWMLKHGIPSEKIVIGAAFYARVWQSVAPKDNGLYQAGKFKKGVNYKDFDTQLSADSGWVFHWDATAKAAYAYHPQKAEFATFDDEQSLAEKVKYLQRYRLGGIMFWELRNDRENNGRLQSIYNALKP